MDFQQKKIGSLLLVHPPKLNNRVMKIIICICFISANLLSLLPFDYTDGNRIPSIIFRRLSSNTFHAFTISLVLAFSTSFIALMIENETKYFVRQIFWYIPVISMALALSILAYATILNWVSEVLQR